MSDPVLVNIDPVNTWQKVATGITNGNFINKQSEDQLFFTFVENGNPAPVGILIGRTLVIDEEVSHVHDTPSDFYFYAKDKAAVIEMQI